MPSIGERNDELMDGLAQRVKEHRKLRNLTQHGLAEVSGVSREVICNLELGRLQSISLDNAIKLSDGLRIPLSALAPQAGHSADEALADARQKLAAIQRVLSA
ncbi:helix-turn-helix transcriptional regulator [Nocardia sp. NPDC050697]|uniref:helix-turn-helix transcriptional regulator n=1 Tax=Nocardia sp. NPDC050697 TaxID=3155158 RepID=UPI0033E6F9F7